MVHAASVALRRSVLFPNHYAWYVLASALDLMMTNTVMTHFGATEANVVAAAMIELGGFWGLIALKFATVLVVVGICEHIGHRRPATARRVAEWAIALSALPVVLAMAQVCEHAS